LLGLALGRLRGRGGLGYCGLRLLVLLGFLGGLFDGFLGGLGGRFIVFRGRGRTSSAAALLQSFDPLLTLVGSRGRNHSLLVLLVTAEFDPELVLLVFRISLLDLDSGERNGFCLSVLLLRVGQFLLLALEGKITLDDFLTEKTFTVLLPDVTTGGFKLLLLLLLRRFLGGFLGFLRLLLLRFLYGLGNRFRCRFVRGTRASTSRSRTS